MIYLDYNATTPLGPEVRQAMMDLLMMRGPLDASGAWGNPSSQHVFGVEAKNKLEGARQQVAKCINANSSTEVIFTSGGTESINWAIKGIAGKFKRDNKKAHIITSVIEHVAVSETIKSLMNDNGCSQTVVAVDKTGSVNPAEVVNAIKKDETCLVTIMLANNEVGTIQPIKKIVEEVRKADSNVIIHTDASQAVGKIHVDVQDLGVDLLTLAGHKFYGPKGIGALYIRIGVESKLLNFMHGAGHEFGLRAGTENVLLATGLGKACEIVIDRLEHDITRNRALRDELEKSLESECNRKGIDFQINGNMDARLPNTLSISFAGTLATDILAKLEGSVACSAGAACHTGAVSVSHVLQSMQIPKDFALGTLRLSVGRFTTQQDAQTAVEKISKVLLSSHVHSS